MLCLSAGRKSMQHLCRSVMKYHVCMPHAVRMPLSALKAATQHAFVLLPIRMQQESKQGFAVVPATCDMMVVVMQASAPWLAQAAAAAACGGCGARIERCR